MKKIVTYSMMFMAGMAAATVNAAPMSRQINVTQPRQIVRADCVMAQSMMSATRAGMNLDDLQLVDNLPETATVKTYSRNSEYFTIEYFGLMHTDDYGAVAKVAYDGDKVYIHSPFSGMPTNTYLVGELSGDKISVTLPQKILVEEYQDYENDPDGTLGLMITDTYYALKLKYTDNGDKQGMSYNVNDQTITYTITENGLQQDGDDFIGMLMAMPAQDENGNEGVALQWAGYADRYMEYSTVNANPITMPEGLNTQSWILRSSNNDARFVNVGIQDNEMYIAGVFSDEQEYVIRGTIDGNKVVFAKDQYLGISRNNNHHAYFVPANYTLLPAEDDSEEYEAEYDYTAIGDLSFNYDAEAKTLTIGEGKAYTISAITGRIYYMEAYNDPSFTWQDDTTPMVPADPVILGYEDLFEDYQFNSLTYNLPSESTDGRMLDAAKCYYNILLDDEPALFSYEDYETGDYEEFTDIPLNYEDFYNITFMGDYYEALIMATGYDKIGIQVFYKNVDGSISKSNRVYYGEDNAISEILNSAEVATTEYFDLSGRRVADNFKGIAIGRYTMTDGSVKVIKVVK